MLHFASKAVHTPFPTNDPFGSIHFPIYESVSFQYDDADEIADVFQGRKRGHVYTRVSNPTVEFLETRLRHLTGAQSCTVVSSGMAALANVLLATCGGGSHIITTRRIFGNTYSLLEHTLKPWGLSVTYADLTDLSIVESSIRPETTAIFAETITNPQMEIFDLPGLGKLSDAHNILLIVDSTATPLIFCNMREIGVHIEIISSTKYISGGGTAIGGVILDHGLYDWSASRYLSEYQSRYGPMAFTARLKREVARNTGACLSPHSAYLHSLGLETLCLRVEKSCRNTLEIARFLSNHPAVVSVNYPGLPSSPFYTLSKRLFGDLSGSILTFRLRSKEACFAMMNRLSLILNATNLHDNRTLALHPASTIFSEYDADLRDKMSVPDTMIRLSVGIEDAADLIEDLNKALEET